MKITLGGYSMAERKITEAVQEQKFKLEKLRNSARALYDISVSTFDGATANIDKDKLKKKMRTQIKTKNKFKKNISVAASICIVGIGLSSVGVLNKSLAYNVPILGSMLQMIQNSLNNNDNLLDSYTEVNKSFSKDGLTVKIDKVVYLSLIHI